MDPTLHEWSPDIPKEIPKLEMGRIDKVENFSSEPEVYFQPEKTLFVLEVSALPDSDVKDYFKNLENDSWETSVVKLMDGNLRYRAEKGDYIVEIEENPMGPDTAYYYVNLSEDATKRLK